MTLRFGQAIMRYLKYIGVKSKLKNGYLRCLHIIQWQTSTSTHLHLETIILLTDSEADAHVKEKPNSRTVSIEMDDNNKDKASVTHDEKPGAQWL